MSGYEFCIWWLGITVGLLVIGTLLYWIVEDLNIDDEIGNKELYSFIEKYFGKRFLKIFKMFI
ncbi:hypothetical protein [Fusobacterium perfoetens]|uniref:hypothetical protein n=1 Tax=Fusobacterium perfoetens TaxID=852 RepID=UPI001F3DF443|nr:hypothetical protein [Fusobacterium perfoetens]MCF2611606.1 hypothetical protein [Fusobacterium perfoetens]